MKKTIASASIVALGISGVQAASDASGFASVDGARPWSVSATLRGFYDDNPNTVPDGPDKQETFGFQVNPALRLNLPLEQTSLSLSYDYSLKYYDERPVGNTDDFDQTHLFNVGVNHAISERYQIAVADSFAIGQEPDVLRAGDAFATFQRIPGDNLRNHGTITLNAQMTRLFGVEAGYANALFDYDDSGPGSLSATLDRIEHFAHVDGRWRVFPETIGVVGYRYGQADYTGDEAIGGGFVSEDRNSRSHYGYGGLDHNFRADLSGSFRAGVRYIDFYNDPAQESEVSPYAQASLTYTYTTQSYLKAGFSYDRNPTDRFSVQGSSITHDAQALVAYASLQHRITPYLYGSLTGQYQNSTFNGGTLDGETENYYLIDVNLEYRFNPYLSAEVGYNYDRVDSDSTWEYARNRVYLGVTASY